MPRSARVEIVSRAIHLNERLVFYPRLRRFYAGQPALQSVVDIGANRGQSIKFFQRLSPEVRVHAFEASPAIFAALARLESPTVSTHNVGVSDTVGHLTFHECTLDETSTFELPDLSSAYLARKARVLGVTPADMFTSTEVPVTTVDSIVSDMHLRRIDVLKVDVEGHELAVLRGAQRTLASGIVRLLQVEEHDNDMRDVRPDLIRELLGTFGYAPIAVIAHGFGSFREVIFAQAA